MQAGCVYHKLRFYFLGGQACCPRLELAAKVDGPCHPRSSCVLGLEVGHASGSNSVRAGPWPKNTPAVLAALAAHCTKAIFFPIGLHATYEPGILKQVAAAGHAIGSHTWCHQDLSKTKGRCNVNGKVQTVEYNPKDEIEKGISAVRWAVGTPSAPISASRRCNN